MNHGKDVKGEHIRLNRCQYFTWNEEEYSVLFFSFLYTFIESSFGKYINSILFDVFIAPRFPFIDIFDFLWFFRFHNRILYFICLNSALSGLHFFFALSMFFSSRSLVFGVTLLLFTRRSILIKHSREHV